MLNGPAIIPKGQKIENIVVFLHGFGANGQDLIGLSEYFSKILKNAAFYSPHAPEDMEGFNLFGGRQWFSLKACGYNMEEIKDDKAWLEKVCKNMLDEAISSNKKLDEYIDGLLEKHELNEKDLILVGFSQGGFMACFNGYQRKNDLKAILCFSAVPMVEDFLEKIKNQTPIFTNHGTNDDVVPIKAQEITKNTLSKRGIKVEQSQSIGLGHGIDENGINNAVKFLEKQV